MDYNSSGQPHSRMAASSRWPGCLIPTCIRRSCLFAMATTGHCTCFLSKFCHLSLQFASRSSVHSSNHHILHLGCTVFLSHVHHKDERWMLGPKSTTKMKDGFGGIDDQWHSHSLGRHWRKLRTDWRILSQLDGVRRGEQQQRLGHEPAHHAFPCAYPRFALSFGGEHPKPVLVVFGVCFAL